MDLAPVLRRAFPLLHKKTTLVLRLAAFLGLTTVLVYFVGNVVSFVVQLFDLSSSEVSKFIKIVTALLSRPNLELEFLPPEFQDLTPSDDGVYAYAPGNFNPILFRRAHSEALKGAWEWSDDGRQWFATDSFRESPSGMPEPPALIFILRLHVEYLIRRRAAIPDAVCRRLPPPLDLGICPADRLDAVPDVLCCPISHGVMSLPVVAPSGTTFDYDSIRRWAQRHNTDPVNGAPLAEGDLYPNLAMRDIVERWLRQQERRACEADPVKAGVERKQEGEEEGDREGSPTHSAPPEEPQPQSGECEDMGHEYAGAGEGVLRDKQSLLPHLVDLS